MMWSTRRIGIATIICVASIASTQAFQRGATTGATGTTTPLVTPTVAPEFSIPTGVGAMFFYVPVAKAVDFEALMTRLKAALFQSKSTARRQQANGWRVFKSAEVDPTATTIVYVWLIDPASVGASYEPIAIFNEEFPAEVQPLTDRFRVDVTKIERMSFTPVMTMGISK